MTNEIWWRHRNSSNPNRPAVPGRTGDRTYKLASGITSEYGRYVKSLGDPVTGERAMLEAMLSIKRAGADMILTYAAADLAARLES